MEGYKTIFVTTFDNRIHEFNLDDCPDFVKEYLTSFYEKGWTPETDELWEMTFGYFTEQVNLEVIESIVGETDWGEDIIYDG